MLRAADHVVDCSDNGRTLSEYEIERMVINDPDADGWDQDMLLPLHNMYWLARSINNLISYFESMNKYGDVGALLEMQILLWPELAALSKDYGLVLSKLGALEDAVKWLVRYIEMVADDAMTKDIQQLVDVIRKG